MITFVATKEDRPFGYLAPGVYAGHIDSARMKKSKNGDDMLAVMIKAADAAGNTATLVYHLVQKPTIWWKWVEFYEAVFGRTLQDGETVQFDESELPGKSVFIRVADGGTSEKTGNPYSSVEGVLSEAEARTIHYYTGIPKPKQVETPAAASVNTKPEEDDDIPF